MTSRVHNWSAATPGPEPEHPQGREPARPPPRHGACERFGGLRLLLLALSLGLSSCLVTTDDFGARVCHKNDDCPGVAGYLCASTAVWPQRGCGAGEEGCLCEVRFPPDVGGIALDGGGPVIPDAGPPPDYCDDIKPILTLNCLGTCHGSQMGYPNSPTDFRLDYWEPGPAQALRDGGQGLPGVKAKLDRIKARIFDEKTMPPPPSDFPIQPSSADRALVNKWIVKFGAPRGDGGCEQGDGGVAPKPDAGAADAGPRDGGVDAGAPVSFSTQILPIFNGGNCNCHTGVNTAGTLSLTAGNAYQQLVVNAQVSAGCATGPQKRVLANQPLQSQLWLKIANDPTKCNNSMPRNLQPLLVMQPGQADLIRRWIQQGAPNN